MLFGNKNEEVKQNDEGKLLSEIMSFRMSYAESQKRIMEKITEINNKLGVLSDTLAQLNAKTKAPFQRSYNDAQEKQIIELLKQGVHVRSITDEMKVSRHAVYRIQAQHRELFKRADESESGVKSNSIR